MLVLAALTAFLWLGPPGSAYRANDAYAACVTRAESLGTAAAEGGLDPEYIAAMSECAEHCEPITDPSWLETVGLFMQTRVSSSRDGPSCLWQQPGFSDIIPFLPGDDMHDVGPRN